MIQYKNENITVFESQLYKTTATVIQTEDCIIVVDPNLLPNEVGDIRQYVDEIQNERPIYLLFTHSDWDHIVGYGAFPEATVIASEPFSKRENKDEIIEQIHAFDDQYYIDRHYPIIYPIVDEVITSDGQQLDIGNTKLTFYNAKGHTDDGIITVIEPLGIFVAGDYLSDLEFPFIYSSSEDYRATLQKTDTILQSHQIKFLIPGHGHATENENEIIRRKNDGLNYIQQLKSALQTKTDHLHLLDGYQYKKSLKNCHYENVEFLMKEENNNK
ncbi:MBL fold metallo-hydrolase [Ureibacillus sp. NPDC094379]